MKICNKYLNTILKMIVIKRCHRWLKKHEARAFIGNVLSYEYKNLVENGNLKVDEQYKVTLPPNLITVLEYDKKDFEGATLKNFIDDVECELSDWEIELYDDPHFMDMMKMRRDMKMMKMMKK